MVLKEREREIKNYYLLIELRGRRRRTGGRKIEAEEAEVGAQAPTARRWDRVAR